jgi:hypothetical protein
VSFFNRLLKVYVRVLMNPAITSSVWVKVGMWLKAALGCYSIVGTIMDCLWEPARGVTDILRTLNRISGRELRRSDILPMGSSCQEVSCCATKITSVVSSGIGLPSMMNVKRRLDHSRRRESKSFHKSRCELIFCDVLRPQIVFPH